MTLFWWRILWHFFKQRWKLCDALSGDSKKWRKCLWLSVRVPLSFTPNAMWQSIVWQPLHSVSSPNHCTLWNKKIKPCDNNLKSAKFYRALDEGILVCFRHESGDGEEDHPSRRWVVYFLIIFFVTFSPLYIASSMPGFSIKTNYSERGGRRVCVIFTLLSDVEGFCPPNTLLPMCCFERIRSEPIDLRNCKRRKSTLVD